MKLYAPGYYKDFKCIADKCEHSCCIGWEIDIDENSLNKYKKLKSGYGAIISDSISAEDSPHFKLCQGDRCPHLDESGLCRIITNLGEDYLCDICREHPRFYNFTEVAEVGIGMSCPEAARIILCSDNFEDMVEIGEVCAVADEIAFDGRTERGNVYAILRGEEYTYEAALGEIYRKYSIDVGDDEGWLELLGSLEYLDEAHKELFISYSSARRPSGNGEYLKRFFSYLVYRHCTEAFDEDDFRLRLAFCLFCERLLASIAYVKKAESLYEFAALAGIISEEIEYSEDNTEALTY